MTNYLTNKELKGLYEQKITKEWLDRIYISNDEFLNLIDNYLVGQDLSFHLAETINEQLQATYISDNLKYNVTTSFCQIKEYAKLTKQPGFNHKKVGINHYRITTDNYIIYLETDWLKIVDLKHKFDENY
jgi:hypothetical protein